MTLLSIRTLVFAGITAASAALPAAAFDARPATTPTVQLAAVQCMTDDGYGRMRPCSASFKRANPDWRASNNCMTDDGYGRYRPCSASYKEKHKN